jgi:propanol-preferring alcohol dehydrogenase
MQAAVLEKFGQPLSIHQKPMPEPQGEEFLVRVKGCGVCHSDLHIVDGQYPELALPLVPGHEISGEADGIGEVLVYGSWGCGCCRACERGEEQLCLKAAFAGWMRDGGYAEYVIVPSKKYLLPLDGLDPVHAAPLADAGVTPYRAVQRIRPWLHTGAMVVVLGVGGLGQFAIQYLKLLTEARVTAVDLSPTKRKRASELGADAVTAPDDLSVSPRAVLDFVGTAETLALATRVVERGGVVVQVGQAGGSIPFGMQLVPHEVILTTSLWGSIEDLSAVLGLARQGRLQWHSEPVALVRANEALARLRRGDVLGRLVLTPEQK